MNFTRLSTGSFQGLFPTKRRKRKGPIGFAPPPAPKKKR
jgi:hypothetical protein